MNLRRFLVASGSHLWKRACTTAASPASASVTAPSAAASVEVSVTAPSAGKVAYRMRKMLSKLQNLKVLGGTVKGNLNAFFKEEDDGVSITQADLVRWAKRLDKDGKHKHACQVFDWMDRKKMTFSPSELATYADLINKTKGLKAAEEYFKKVDPDFDNMDHHAKNWPAYAKFIQIMVLKCPLCS